MCLLLSVRRRMSCGLREPMMRRWPYQVYETDGDDMHGLVPPLREHLGSAFPLVHETLDKIEVAESAIIFHWPGKEHASKPVLITNRHAFDLVQDDQSASKSHTSPSTFGSACGGFHPDFLEALADVESGVGMLTAAESLLRAGYEPQRTLVFVIMLGKARDVPLACDHLQQLHHGPSLPTEPPSPQFQRRGGTVRRLSQPAEALSALRALFDTLSSEITALLPILGAQPAPVSGGKSYRKYDTRAALLSPYVGRSSDVLSPLYLRVFVCPIGRAG
ncbi:hypothetical protein BC834DRAFT_598936 [Gloeopeniophorella convolvens]|nr:hypothetical protein BC834DRAFT_598936 [Gloeopeniophorella convolvens]